MMITENNCEIINSNRIMIAKEIQHIVYLNTGCIKPDTHNYRVEDGVGIEHALWATLCAKFPPPMPWNRLRGAERGQILRAAKILDNNNIPYSTYANFLERFEKGFLMHKSPMLITAFKEKASGGHHILSDFIAVVNHLLYHYNKNIITLEILDRAYTTYPKAYAGGMLHMIFTADTIAEVQDTNSLLEIFRMLSASKSIEEFTDRIGTKKLKKHISKKMDGSASQAAKMLVIELRIRRGKIDGTVDPKLDKYFNTNNTLNARGLKLVSGT